ncbi:hypothetical protein HK102_012895 [Quaeritorhiza haematococci]|nr:hypothetical protein HK102_012895 [Quaeritorhiza haematococci]
MVKQTRSPKTQAKAHGTVTTLHNHQKHQQHTASSQRARSSPSASESESNKSPGRANQKRKADSTSPLRMTDSHVLPGLGFTLQEVAEAFLTFHPDAQGLFSSAESSAAFSSPESFKATSTHTSVTPPRTDESPALRCPKPASFPITPEQTPAARQTTNITPPADDTGESVSIDPSVILRFSRHLRRTQSNLRHLLLLRRPRCSETGCIRLISPYYWDAKCIRHTEAICEISGCDRLRKRKRGWAAELASRPSEDDESVVTSTHPPIESTCPKHFRARQIMETLAIAPSPPEKRWTQFLHIPTHQLGSLSFSQIQAFYDQTPSSLDQEFSDMVKDYLGRQGLRIPRALWSSFVRFMEDVMDLGEEEDGDGDGGVEELWDDEQDEDYEADERTRRQKRARTSSNSSAQSAQSNGSVSILALPRGVADLGRVVADASEEYWKEYAELELEDESEDEEEGVETPTDKPANGSVGQRTPASTESDQPELDAMREDTTTTTPNGADDDAHNENNGAGEQEEEEQQVEVIDVDAEDALRVELPSDLVLSHGELAALLDDMNTPLEDIFLEEYANAMEAVSVIERAVKRWLGERRERARV